jgi:hypothetical protein
MVIKLLGKLLGMCMRRNMAALLLLLVTPVMQAPASVQLKLLLAFHAGSAVQVHDA